MMPEAERRNITLIDADILAKLGLDPNEVESAFLQEARSKGEECYRDHRWGTMNAHGVTVTIEHTLFQPKAMGRTDLPSHLVEEWKRRRTWGHFLPEEVPVMSHRINAFLVGYGEAALDNADWKTAVEALDLVLEGGISASEEHMKKLGTLADSLKQKGQFMEAVYMMARIQEKVDIRQQPTSSSVN